MKYNFVKGLDLNEGYYHDVIKPLLKNHYPELNYSAGLIGYGSDVLGYDTAISMDHNWGPRLVLFLSESDLEKYHGRLDELFRAELPYTYKGFPTNFSNPGEDGTQRMKEVNCKPISHLIRITSASEFLKGSIGRDNLDGLQLTDWLQFTQQGLIEITEGKVFYDGLGTLEKIRGDLNFYPDDVLRLKLAALWQYISNEEAFIGRNIDIGEELGARLIASRIVNALMKICFYTERKYIPYSKWFSKAFNNLKCSEELSPIFTKILSCDDVSIVEGLICEGYQKVIALQNNLNICKGVELKVQSYYGRPYKVVFTEEVVEALKNSIEDSYLKGVNIDSVSLIECVDGVDLTENKDMVKNLISIKRP